jgi:hypothetical protein
MVRERHRTGAAAAEEPPVDADRPRRAGRQPADPQLDGEASRAGDLLASGCVSCRIAPHLALVQQAGQLVDRQLGFVAQRIVDPLDDLLLGGRQLVEGEGIRDAGHGG